MKYFFLHQIVRYAKENTLQISDDMKIVLNKNEL